MLRMTEDGMSASVGQKAKQATLRCPNCSIELNLPESAWGRRLKCPKCETKFTAPTGPSPSSRNAASSMYLPIRDGSNGSIELPSYGSGDVELPTSLASLRDTYDVPLVSDHDSPASSRSSGKAGASGVGDVGDAMALFKDEPKSNRKPRGAEARAQARRCSSCSSIVPAGMSLCSRCGLDLDTGHRVEPMEIYDDEAPAIHRPQTPPIGVLAVGSFCTFGFLLLSMISLVQWGRGTQGAQFLLVIWLFGLFGCVQFLRRKSIRPIFMALSLAVGVGAVYLIVLPIYYANMPPEVTPTDAVSLTTTLVEDFDAPQIRSITESLDLNRITWGVGSLLSYAVLAVYLNSNSLRRHFKH